MPLGDSNTRPDFHTEMSAAEFDRWYWSRAELAEICDQLAISKTGVRAVLRARVIAALKGEPLPKPDAPRPKSRFPWAKATLDQSVVITDNVSFGPNVRRWFASVIGPRFVCHGDFMAWVRENVGATLGDAVAAWHELEARKDDPNFRREIAPCNTYLRYLRAFRDSCPDKDISVGRHCWAIRKTLPAPGGEIIFDKADLDLL